MIYSIVPPRLGVETNINLNFIFCSSKMSFKNKIIIEFKTPKQINLTKIFFLNLILRLLYIF